MANYTLASRSTPEIDALSADKPTVMATNVLESATAVGWYSGVTSATDVQNPEARAHDRVMYLTTQPLVQGPEVSTYRLVATLPSGLDFSGFFCGAHNWHLSGDETVTGHRAKLRIADDLAFSTNAIDLWDSGLLTGAARTAQRFASANLYDLAVPANQNQTISTTGVCYLALELSVTGGTYDAATLPSLGELIVGRLRQFPFKSNTRGIFDDKAAESDVVDFVPDSGAVQRYVRHKGKLVLPVSYSPTGSDASIDWVTILRRFFEECEFGTQPFVYIENPKTANSARIAYLMLLDEPALRMPIQQWVNRETSLTLVEQPTFYYNENAGAYGTG